MNFKLLILFFFSPLLISCVNRPPADVNNVCRIFRQYPQWYWNAQDVERRWRIPIAVQMAIIHQESKFDGRAKPPRTKLLGIVPWKGPSTASGYTQALSSTWRQYKMAQGGGRTLASRGNFADGVDFIGWYANQAYLRAGIPHDNAYELYLAYHEGIGGYMRRTYLAKPWLIQVARKVKARSQLFQAELNLCRYSLPKKPWYKL